MGRWDWDATQSDFSSTLHMSIFFFRGSEAKLDIRWLFSADISHIGEQTAQPSFDFQS